MSKRNLTNQELQGILERMNKSERFGVAFAMFPMWVEDEFHPTKADIVQLMTLQEKEVPPPKEDPGKNLGDFM